MRQVRCLALDSRLRDCPTPHRPNPVITSSAMSSAPWLRAISVTRCSQPARLRNHSRRALNQRLENKRGVGISLSFLRRKFLFHQPDAFPVALAIFAGVGAFRLGAIERTPIAIRRHDLVRLEQQTGIAFVKQINVTERNRADGVAVIGAFERKKSRFNLAAACGQAARARACGG